MQTLFQSLVSLQGRLRERGILSAVIGGIAVRQRDYDDAESVIRRQGDDLDNHYVLTWLSRFEQALDDSTLVATYQRLRARWT